MQICNKDVLSLLKQIIIASRMLHETIDLEKVLFYPYQRGQSETVRIYVKGTMVNRIIVSRIMLTKTLSIQILCEDFGTI